MCVGWRTQNYQFLVSVEKLAKEGTVYVCLHSAIPVQASADSFNVRLGGNFPSAKKKKCFFCEVWSYNTTLL